MKPERTASPQNLPTVSVVMTTYNHAGFIARAIDSVLMQSVDFPVEVLIGEDESSDGTREIVLEYRERFPDELRVFLRRRADVIHIDGNATGRRNFMETIAAARGKYIALLEGDDYWISPDKLRRQVAFLEAHPRCSACFHRAHWLDQDSGEIIRRDYGPREVKTLYTLDDLLENHNFIPTCSVMFRNRNPQAFPPWFQHISFGDLPLHILNAMDGDIGFIDESMAVYRLHEGGLHTGDTTVRNLEKLVRTYRVLDEHLGLRGKPSFRRGLAKWHLELSVAQRQEKLGKNSLRSLMNGLKTAPGGFKLYILREALASRFRLFEMLFNGVKIFRESGLRGVMEKLRDKTAGTK